MLTGNFNNLRMSKNFLKIPEQKFLFTCSLTWSRHWYEDLKILLIFQIFHTFIHKIYYSYRRSSLFNLWTSKRKAVPDIDKFGYNRVQFSRKGHLNNHLQSYRETRKIKHMNCKLSQFAASYFYFHLLFFIFIILCLYLK